MPNKLSVTLPNYLNQAQLDFINRKTPPKYIKTRPGRGGKSFKYVEIGYIQEVLNQMFGYDWDFEIVDQGVGKTQVWVRGKLTVRINRDGTIQTITKSQYGGSDIKFSTDGKALGIGDDLKSAASDCLKKCASMIGIANDVYSNEIYDLAEPVHEQVRRERQQEEFTEGEVVEEPGEQKVPLNSAQVTLIRKLVESGKIKMSEASIQELSFNEARRIIQDNG